jgi:hypothetical protein
MLTVSCPIGPIYSTRMSELLGFCVVTTAMVHTANVGDCESPYIRLVDIPAGLKEDKGYGGMLLLGEVQFAQPSESTHKSALPVSVPQWTQWEEAVSE